MPTVGPLPPLFARPGSRYSPEKLDRGERPAGLLSDFRDAKRSAHFVFGFRPRDAGRRLSSSSPLVRRAHIAPSLVGVLEPGSALPHRFADVSRSFLAASGLGDLLPAFRVA